MKIPQSKPWLSLSTNCYPEGQMTKNPSRCGSLLAAKRGVVLAHRSMHATVMITTSSSMQNSSSPLLGYTLPSFGIGVGPLRRQLAMQSFSSMRRRSKRRL